MVMHIKLSILFISMCKIRTQLTTYVGQTLLNIYVLMLKTVSQSITLYIKQGQHFITCNFISEGRILINPCNVQ